MKQAVNALFFAMDTIGSPFINYMDYNTLPNYYDYPEGYYNFYTCAVPRVSNILKETIYAEELINWFKNCDKDMINTISDNALIVGYVVHESIEEYIKLASNGIAFELDSVVYNVIKKGNYRLSDTLLKHAMISYKNFVIWYTDMIARGYELEFLDIERSTVNPWYGGTIDAIVKITNKKTLISKVYVLDFKTSKRITMNYWLQTYAYYWSLSWEYRTLGYGYPNINGIAVLRLPKNKMDTTEFISIDFTEEANNNFHYDLDRTFKNMVKWYYDKHNLEGELKSNGYI